jgi:ubiquinone/menaquinone biosynthesis C-methylase UbiE
MADSWNDRAYLRGTQYKTDTNLAARQSIYAYAHPRVNLFARVIDLAGPAPSDTIADVGCGNGAYLAELAGRDLPCRVLGVDLSLGMLAAARQRLTAAGGLAGPGPAVGPAGEPAATAPRSGSGNAAGPGGVARLVRVALACADATALPLRDGAADLTLAAHMLYHVPEPADALRELRRVTRPGGRVVIVLNGASHLGQLRAAIAAALGDTQGGYAERVTLDDGESLARSFFGEVTRHDFVSELRVPEPAPIADYVRSLPGTRRSSDPEDFAATVAATFPRDHEGHYVITARTGCLICLVD